MKICITGGSGYIGTWLAKRLLDNGHEIRIIDVVPPQISDRDVEYCKVDITDKNKIDNAIKGCEVVYHLAAVVSKLRGVEDREVCIQTNVNGTLYVLEACRMYDIKRLIYMGTSEVLGESMFTPTDERHPRFPMTTYGITKCAGEDLCFEYHRAYGLNTVMPRLYMVYGIDDTRKIKYHNVIVKFIWNALHDESPIAFKDCVRSFLYISDCVDALSLLLERGKPGQIYDICDKPEYAITMEALAMRVIKLCKKKIKPIVKDPPTTDTKVKLPSGYKAYAELRWEPKVRLDDGLRMTVDWVKSNIDNIEWQT